MCVHISGTSIQQLSIPRILYTSKYITKNSPLRDRGFRRTSPVQAVCHTSTARTTGFISPPEAYQVPSVPGTYLAAHEAYSGHTTTRLHNVRRYECIPESPSRCQGRPCWRWRRCGGEPSKTPGWPQHTARAAQPRPPTLRSWCTPPCPSPGSAAEQQNTTARRKEE